MADSGRDNLLVLLATDVEIWPRARHFSPIDFEKEFRRFIYGPTPRGDYGLPFQLKMYREYDLKAVFLVDALFASIYGISYLQEVVDLIRDAGQEVQLHMHTEWVERTDSLLPGKSGRNMRDFSREDQGILVKKAIENMQACGVNGLSAFRAGNFGANWDTLDALTEHGIVYDTSYNIPYIGSTCDLKTDPPLVQPAVFQGIIEFPISFFVQGTGNYRHAQVGSCSFGELSSMLQQAIARGWHSFQILSHNFELLNRAKSRPDAIVIKRFEKLCAFLAANRDRFTTAWFGELDPGRIPVDIRTPPLRSNWFRTVWRYGEQLTRRFFR
ncbi:MAG: polysaccharide deacetylase family protein [Planctomycetota bacterium]|jgi:hypothetical protein